MFKQVFRVAFVTLIWKQYKHIIVSTIILFAFLFLVGNLHADFLKHAELQGNKTGLGLSFVYKWLAFALGVGLYFTYHYLRTNRTSKKSPKGKIATHKAMDQGVDDEDPFSNIRAKKKLRSRADFLIDGETGKK